MGHDYDEHMDIIEEELREHEGEFTQAMRMGGPPLITRTPEKCPACGAGLRKVWLQDWYLACSGNTPLECWKVNAITYWPYEAGKDMDCTVASAPQGKQRP